MNQGEGLAFLAESSTSPSRARLQKLIAGKFPKSQWFTCDAIDSGIHQRAATLAFGRPVRPVFHFDKAKIILSLDCDFLGSEDDAHNHIRRFVKGRNPEANGGMSRLYAVESLFTLTGASADHRMRVPASLIPTVASEIFTQVSNLQPFLARWIRECARDLHANPGKVLVVAGQRQPMEVHLLAHALNSALGAIGNTMTLLPATEMAGADFNNLDASATDTLVVLGGNPVYDLELVAEAENRRRSFGLDITRTRRLKSRIGIFHWRTTSNPAATRRRAMECLFQFNR